MQVLIYTSKPCWIQLHTLKWTLMMIASDQFLYCTMRLRMIYPLQARFTTKLIYRITILPPRNPTRDMCSLPTICFRERALPTYSASPVRACGSARSMHAVDYKTSIRRYLCYSEQKVISGETFGLSEKIDVECELYFLTTGKLMALPWCLGCSVGVSPLD